MTADAGEDVEKEEYSSIGDPEFSPMVGCEHPPLYLSGSGRDSQETAVIRLLSSCTFRLPQWCLGLVIVYGMDLQVGQFLDGFSFSLFSTFCLRICSHEYFVTPSKKDRSTHTLFFLLFELHVVCELYLGYSELLA